MTIHKSKGLEFEIVIVPDLQSSAARGKTKLLSWLERGLAEADAADEATEFLVAPLQAKGSERGTAKAWVDCVYRSRELQEMRRLLYVAATRAREELHLFAQPAYKREKDGSFTLVKPRENLLATAWPAVEAEVRTRFDALRIRVEQSVIIESLAAAEEIPLARERGTPLRRLPPGYEPQQAAAPASAMAQSITGAGRLYDRHEGGVLSRALGTAVHVLLEELARLRLTVDGAAARSALARMESRMTAQIRAAGVERPQAMRIARDALAITLKASGEPIGEWILSPHAEAASEVRWAGVVAGNLQTVQVDRVFRAGPEPLTEDGDAWWVIDFKTAHAEGVGLEGALPKLRTIFAPQVESYAKVLRNLHGAATTVRCGLYYPRMLKFDWWEI
jgi:ATP-dependent exoDNAse (exonuclease V) beta subunit